MNDTMSEAALELPAVPDLPEAAPRLAVLLHQGLAAVLDAFGDGAGGRDAREAVAVADRLVAWCHAAAEALAGLPRVPPAVVTVNGQVYWYLDDGTLVPAATVGPRRLVEDQMVRQLVEQALWLHEELLAFRAAAMEAATAYQDRLAQLYADGAEKPPRRAQANISYFSVDRRWKIEVEQADRTVFGPSIEVARERFLAFVNSLHGQPILKAMVHRTLGLDRQGYIRPGEVLRLRNCGRDETHPDWVAAMQALEDAMDTMVTGRRLRVYQRDQYGTYVLVKLAFAKM